jgi:hypothetical protein
MNIDKNNFETFLESINCCYAKDIAYKLPLAKDFQNDFFTNDNIDISKLETVVHKYQDVYKKSVALRLLAILKFIERRDSNIEINIKEIWYLISKSILTIPKEAVISSIGSQGFLSIPLFKFDKDKNKFEFIRLHIWDKSLDKFINKNTCSNFSLHTHSFFAESWIICGEIINNRYRIIQTDKKTDNSLFTIGYNKSLNEINQHTSIASNTNKFVEIKQISSEKYFSDSNYSINAGNYHKSISEGDNQLSATLFSFIGKKGFVEQSYVVGPSNIQTSEINRKMYIDPTELINNIIKKVNEND